MRRQWMISGAEGGQMRYTAVLRVMFMFCLLAPLWSTHAKRKSDR